jgi:hypothetical protein
MPKTKEGEQISWKEFFSRWKEGIEGITPKQKVLAELAGTRVMLLGIILGIIMTIVTFDKTWWVTIILVGVLINTGMQYLGKKQQLEIFSGIEEQMKGGDKGNA